MIRLNNKILILVIVGCTVLFQACPIMEEDIRFIYLENNSNDILGVYVADGFHSAYPDTLLPDKFQNGLLGGVPKGNMTGGIYNFISPEDICKRLPKDTLSIFILSMNNYNEVEMDSIWEEMKYGTRFFLRYDMSMQDLKVLNNSIPYPPDERMKDMKMYPPYDE